MPWSATISSTHVALDPHPDLHAGAGLAVLHGVLDEVAERRDELAAVAVDPDAGRQLQGGRPRCGGPRRAGECGRSRPRRRRRRRRSPAAAPRRARCATARAGRRWSGVTRIASSTMRSATRWTTSRSSSSASASASTARAPTGVFSSWLMLATKSVRTASTRRRSLTSSIVATAPPPSSGAAVTTTALRGGPYSSRFWRDDSPARAPCSSRSTVSSTSSPMCVPAKAPAARLRWWIATARTGHDDPDAELGR